MRKGKKTQKKLELRLKNKENRQKAGLKSCFWALIGTNRDESAFWGRRAGRRVSVSNRDCPDPDEIARDGWQVCKPCLLAVNRLVGCSCRRRVQTVALRLHPVHESGGMN